MPIVFNDKIQSYLEGFNQFKNLEVSKDLKWLNELREKAVNTFSELGFPTTRDEDWRFTNLAPISRNTFQLVENGKADLRQEDIKSFYSRELDSYLLVFIDGKFVSEFSDLDGLPEGVIVSGLSEALQRHESKIVEYLGRFANFENESFIALNTAFFEDGVYVYVPKSTILEKPVYALYITSSGDAQSLNNPRNLIIVEENSELKILEHYVSTSENVYLSNVVSEVVVGENSNVEHYMLEFESAKAFNISTLRVQQERNSNITSHSVLLGGAIVRNNVHPVLAGEGCNSLINGLYMSTDRQHMDNFMRVEHASPHCDSRQFYNGVLDKRSRGVFHGRIIVHEGAEKTDAKQTNRNLLLSDTAQIDTKPQLEIYNDDVKCTHGATIGQMDDNAIFYLQSRGISKREAQSIMLQAFTSENLSNMSLDPVKIFLERKINGWFENRIKR